jgi:osmotically-inducible protein OsmY
VQSCVSLHAEDMVQMTRTKHFVAVAAGCLALFSGIALADGTQLTDEQITDRVVGKLSVDDPAVVKHVQVATKDGVVTLSGNALTGTAVLKAVKDAQSVVGVVKVQNHLSIQQ